MSRARDAADRIIGPVVVVLASAGAVFALSAFLLRVPARRVSDSVWTGSQWGAVTVVLGAFAVLAVLAGAVIVFAHHRGWVVMTVAGLVATLGYLFWSEVVENVAVVTGGAGSHHVGGWLYASVLCLLAAGVVALFQRRRSSVKEIGGVVVVGVVIAVVAQVVFPTPGTSALAIEVDVQPAPSSLGTDVAYRIDGVQASTITPAGAGFVAVVDDSLVAYDGSSGQERWRRESRDFVGTYCHSLDKVTSTGAGPDSVVVVSCSRWRRDFDDPYFLIGVDAMTGEILWTDDRDWQLVYGAPGVRGDVLPVAVLRDDTLGVLDPRTGRARWEQSLRWGDGEPPSAASMFVTSQGVVVLSVDGRSIMVRIFDVRTGAEQIHRVPVARDADVEDVYPVSIGERRVVARLDFGGREGRTESVLVDLDTGANRVVERESWGDAHQGRRRMVDLYVGGDRFWYSGDAAPVIEVGHLDSDQVTRAELPAGLSSRPAEVPASQSWVRLPGGDVVTGMFADTSDWRYGLTIIHPDGSVTSAPSPCAESGGGIVVVPGAVLVACHFDTVVYEESAPVIGFGDN